MLRIDIIQYLRSADPFSVTQDTSVGPDSALYILHTSVSERRNINILTLKYLQPLPHTFDTFSRHPIAERYGNPPMRIKRTQ